MQVVSYEEIAMRQQRADEWISLADLHIRAAKHQMKRPGSETIVLFHLQQSMEKATKGLARAAGIPHHKLRGDIGHNNLFLLVKVIEIVVDSFDGYEDINNLLSNFYREGKDYNVTEHIHGVLSATASPKQARALQSEQYAKDIFTSALRMTPDEVNCLLSSFDKIRRAMVVPPIFVESIVKLTADPVKIQIPERGTNWIDNIANQASQQLLARIGAQASPALMGIIRNLAQESVRGSDISEEAMIAELEANKGNFYFDGQWVVKELPYILDMLTADLGLLIMGSLVWAHESYPRYPAYPDAPDEIEQAARQRKLGTKHYDSRMGVIRHIKPLMNNSERTIRLLKRSHEAGYLLMGASDVKSANT